MMGYVGDKLLDSCSEKEKQPLLAFLKASNIMAEMKKTTRRQWNGSGVTEVQGVSVGSEHLMPLIEAVMRHRNTTLYKSITKGKAGKTASAAPTASCGMRGVTPSINVTESEIGLNRIMEFHNLPGGESIELHVPAGVPAREVIIDLENESIKEWASIELHAINGSKSTPTPTQHGTALHLSDDALADGVRKLVLTNSTRTAQQVKIKEFKLLLPPPGEWFDARCLTDTDLTTSVDCSHNPLKFTMAVPAASHKQVILVGTAEAEITPGKLIKNTNGMLYHSIPKGTDSVEISVKQEKGARLNEIIFR
jgi:hypothetical protein